MNVRAVTTFTNESAEIDALEALALLLTLAAVARLDHGDGAAQEGDGDVLDLVSQAGQEVVVRAIVVAEAAAAQPAGDGAAAADEETWKQLEQAEFKKLAAQKAEWKRLRDLRQLATAEEVLGLVREIAESVNRNVRDPRQRLVISDDILRLTNRPNNEGEIELPEN
jgi:hypothetical protein